MKSSFMLTTNLCNSYNLEFFIFKGIIWLYFNILNFKHKIFILLGVVSRNKIFLLHILLTQSKAT